MKTLAIVAALAAFAATLSAQAIDPDTFKVNYISNANCGIYPDGIVQISNDGTGGGSLCADIYVFEPDQELSECCGCNITKNGLITLSVNNDLTSNPLSGSPITNGMIKIVSSSNSPNCKPQAPKPAAGIHAWATHIEPYFDGHLFVTETPFSDSGLSAKELSNLAAQCSAIQLVGSGHGVCTCGTGDVTVGG